MAIIDILSYIFFKLIICTSVVFALFTPIFPQATIAGTLPLVKCAEYAPEFGSVSSFRYDEGIFYVAGRSGQISAIDLSDGKQNWSAELGGNTVSEPFVGKDHIYIVTAPIIDEPLENPAEAFLRSIGKTTGLTGIIVKLPFAAKYFLDVRSDPHIAAVSSEGAAALISAINGEIVWQRDGLGTVEAVPAFTDSTITIATVNGPIITLSRTDGTVIEQNAVTERITALSAAGNSNLVYGDESGRLSFASDGGKSVRWSFKTGGSISNIIAIDEGLLVSSFDNFIYLIRTDNGKVTWRRRLPSRLIYSPVVQEGTVVVPVYGEEYILTLNVKDGKFVNRIEMGTEIYSDSSPQILSKNSFSILADNKIIVFKPLSCK